MSKAVQFRSEAVHCAGTASQAVHLSQSAPIGPAACTQGLLPAPSSKQTIGNMGGKKPIKLLAACGSTAVAAAATTAAASPYDTGTDNKSTCGGNIGPPAAAGSAATGSSDGLKSGAALPPPTLTLVSSALLASGGGCGVTAHVLTPMPAPAAGTVAPSDKAGGRDGRSAGPAVTVTAPAVDPAVLAAAVTASKLGLTEQLAVSLGQLEGLATARDGEGRTCLHYAAGYGHEECVDALLAARGEARARDANGDVPLHFAAIHGHPMCAYNIAKACPGACLLKNARWGPV